MDWTAEAIERLKALWAEGHSTAEIGRRMGISKNAVVGKAHRLNLPARPSPIRRDAEPRPAPAPRAPRPIPAARVAPPAMLRPASMAPQPAPVVAVAPPPVVRPFPAARPRLGSRSCCWPIGEPGTAGFRFCGAEPMSGKPYCTEHAALAYVKPRDRREDAA
ncbi:GcrA family cell cycle regulator [Roseomonas sp. HJA6]|uniref:GcrA family cell cycle regulator n=1 Tax=Roseomonas alba TaxID=2846776 RepID=A0ABS7A7P7_9PROT|nr:GcrA family cell cycle regulator [Neoroseomonas alba]MBW6397787.1 GcrA family cell cycle regulator [Neoroseomonas alba]